MRPQTRTVSVIPVRAVWLNVTAYTSGDVILTGLQATP